jgi:hypothetical protein
VARYSVTANKAMVNTANTWMFQLRAAATQRVWLYELGIFIEAAPATAPVIRLNRPTAVGACRGRMRSGRASCGRGTTARS